MTADTVGGVWTYALELARGLDEYNIEVALATMGPRPTRSQCEQAAEVANVDLFKSVYKLEWMKDPWADMKAAADWLLDLENRLKPDVVHLNSYAHAALPWRNPKLLVGHSCVSSWWRAVHQSCPPSEWQEYNSAVQRGLRAAELVITPTRAMLDALNESYPGCVDGRASVIPNGLDPDSFSPALKNEFILTAGRLWDKAKNIQALVDIAPYLSWPVCLAGEAQNADGSVVAALKQLNCYALGRLPPENLRRWYACASIYALPALYEPFGLTVLEAALSGCALVLGAIPSLKENWNGAAVFVNPQNAFGLRDALLKVIADEAYRYRLGRAARERALQLRTTLMVEKYLDAYSELLSGRQKKGRAVGA